MFTLAKILAQLHVSQSKGIQVNGCKQKHSGTFYQYYIIISSYEYYKYDD